MPPLAAVHDFFVCIERTPYRSLPAARTGTCMPSRIHRRNPGSHMGPRRTGHADTGQPRSFLSGEIIHEPLPAHSQYVFLYNLSVFKNAPLHAHLLAARGERTVRRGCIRHIDPAIVRFPVDRVYRTSPFPCVFTDLRQQLQTGRGSEAEPPTWSSTCQPPIKHRSSCCSSFPFFSLAAAGDTSAHACASSLGRWPLP